MEKDNQMVPNGDSGILASADEPVTGDGTELTVADGQAALGDGPSDDSVVLAQLEATGEHDGAQLKLGWEGELPAPSIADNQASYDESVTVPVEGTEVEPLASRQTEESTAPEGEAAPEATSDASSSPPKDSTDTSEDPSASAENENSSASPAEEQPSAGSSEKASASPSPTATENPETRDSAAADARVVVEPLRSGFSHRTVLDTAPEGDVVLRFPISLSKGLKLVKDEETGDLRVLDAQKQTVFFAPAPTMWDAKIDEASGLPAADTFIDTELSEVDGVPVLTLRAEASWLQDSARQYPVTIDPTWSSGVSDTWVQADVPGSKAGDPELRVGTFNGGSLKSRSFLQFSSASVLTGKKITKAELRMHNYYSYSCSSAPVKVQRLTSAWVSSDVRWTAQPSATTSGEGTNNVSKGYSSSCAAGYVYYPITPIAQYWADNPTKNFGVRLIAADETNNLTWKRYLSANHINDANDPIEPQFVVTYNSYPATPSATSLSGYTTKDSSGKIWSTTKTPTFQATVSDPDGGSVFAEFDMSGPSSLSKAKGGEVASKQVSKHKVAAALAENGTYTVNAWANDKSLRSKSAGAALTFTVDSAAPSAPGITSTGGVTNNGWQATKPSANVFAFSSSADTARFEYQRNNEAWKSVNASSGKATLDWNPTGANVLRVKAIDKATNTWSVTTWTFGNGVASLTSPTAGSTTSDAFRVTGQGPTSSTGAVTPRVYWREAGVVTADTSQYGSREGWHEGAILSQIAQGQPVKVDTEINIATSPAGKLKELGKDRIPALVELQVCFDYSAKQDQSNLQCTTNKSKKSVQVTKLPHAFGDNYPVAEAGDGQVALSTGELNLSETDVEVNAGNTGLSLSRSYSSYSGIGAN